MVRSTLVPAQLRQTQWSCPWIGRTSCPVEPGTTAVQGSGKMRADLDSDMSTIPETPLRTYTAVPTLVFNRHFGASVTKHEQQRWLYRLAAIRGVESVFGFRNYVSSLPKVPVEAKNSPNRQTEFGFH